MFGVKTFRKTKMQIKLPHKYGDINLTLVVDYDQDGVTLEEIHHKGEDISEIVDVPTCYALNCAVKELHSKLLEADAQGAAEEKWERDMDK